MKQVSIQQEIFIARINEFSYLTLDGMESAIVSSYHVNKSGRIGTRLSNPHKVNFVRDEDDFIVTAESEETAKEIAELIKGFLKE